MLTDTIPCIRVIKSFAGEKRAVDRFKRYNGEWLKVDLKIGADNVGISLYSRLCRDLRLAADMERGRQLGHKRTGRRAFTRSSGFVYFIRFDVLRAGKTFFAYLSDSYQSALAAAERILDILDAEPEQSPLEGKKARGHTRPHRVQERKLFVDRTKKVLSDVSVTIEPGDIVGIVGTTGKRKIHV